MFDSFKFIIELMPFSFIINIYNLYGQGHICTLMYCLSNYATISWPNFLLIEDILRKDHLVSLTCCIVSDSFIVNTHLDALCVNFYSVFITVKKDKFKSKITYISQEYTGSSFWILSWFNLRPKPNFDFNPPPELCWEPLLYEFPDYCEWLSSSII